MGPLKIIVSLTICGLVLFQVQPRGTTPTFSDWSAPVNLDPSINSTANDEGPAISRDGLSLYFTSDREGGFGLQDLWVAQRADQDAPWGAPMNLGATVNTSSREQAPAFSRDERYMVFVSNRPGGAGGFDLWVSFRRDKEDDFGWEEPVNLSDPINTASNDAGPGLLRSRSDTLLFITSNRPGGAGAGDIYVSRQQKDGSFSTPLPVAELNSNVQDARAALRRDGQELFFFSSRVGSVGLTDLWTSTREDLDAPWSAPINLGPRVNSSSDDQQPAISGDATSLFFASNRPGGSGLLDLYVITRHKNE